MPSGHVCAVSNEISSISRPLQLSAPVEQRAKIDHEACQYRQGAEYFE